MYQFLDTVLGILILVSIAWPINVPIMMLAYKVRQGHLPVVFEWPEFVVRALLASLGLALESVLVVALYGLLVLGAELPKEPVQLVLLLGAIPSAVWFLFWVFAYDDLLEALSLFLIYTFLPGLLLFLVCWLFDPFGAWPTMTLVGDWLESLLKEAEFL